MDGFQLLADPTRRKLVEVIAEKERKVGEIVNATNFTQPAVSKQLRLLRNGNMVSVRKDKQARFYRLQLSGFSEIRKWIEKIDTFWSSKLDGLEKHLDNV